ncbi:MAG: hypothetical protein HYZ28_12695 [Myxococcales bacterium]|nr:hypothetical protein [Myxococcales bacterium]
MKPLRRCGAASLALISALACSGAGAPAGSPGDRCFGCHAEDALFAEGEGEGLAPREWMAKAGSGLVLSPLASGVEVFTLPWPRRGRHGPADRNGCPECHPVQPGGTGHGAAKLLAPPDDSACAGCHDWIPSDAASTGYGARPSWQGSLRPDALLSEGTDAHARIFRDGFSAAVGSGAKLLVQRIGRGCAGCHAMSSEAHGGIPSCPDCHRFGTAAEEGSEAALHASYIAAGRTANDPAHEGEADCLYCHGFAPTADQAYRMACYGCHLSGHRPDAVFWPR